jgi:hypothetical protein
MNDDVAEQNRRKRKDGEDRERDLGVTLKDTPLAPCQSRDPRGLIANGTSLEEF